MKWLRIRELVRKEFIQLFRDERNRRILIIAPLVQILVFGYVVNFDIHTINVALLDLSNTRESRLIVDNFKAGGTFQITHHARDVRDLEELIMRGEVDLGLKIPPDLSDRIRRGKTSEVQVLVDGTVSNMAAIRVSYVMTVLERINRQFIRELYPFKMTYGQIDNRLRTWYNPTSTASTSSCRASWPSPSCSAPCCSHPWRSSRKRRPARWNSSSSRPSSPTS